MTGVQRMAIFLSIVVSAFIVSACSSDPASGSKLLRYAKMNYGDAVCVSVEETNDSRTCYFQDEEYGFSYWVKSTRNAFSMDGSKFFHFEDKQSNFEDAYYQYLYEALRQVFDDVKDRYRAEIVPVDLSSSNSLTVRNLGLVSLYVSNTEETNIIEVCREITEQYQDMDQRGYFADAFIIVYDMNSQRLGKYSLAEGEFLDVQEEKVKHFQMLAKLKDETSEYQYRKSVLAEEFTELADIPAESVSLYYFQTENGQLYYIADVIIHGEYYSNYKKP